MQNITKADQADVPALNALINSAYRGESSKQGWTTEADLLGGVRSDEDMLRAMLKDPRTIFLKYVENDEIIGCVRLETHGKRLYIAMLTVSPRLQGGGIGKKLLKASEEEGLRQHCTSTYMTVISIRSELVAWYERHGYMRTGESKPFVVEHPRYGVSKVPLELIVLEKELEAD